ncbi:MAG: hypothetical protein K6F37_08010, partial [Lachnospiraceae bacterium]|nr:hypothetical protein [Lachnospiraceae bacterium]
MKNRVVKRVFACLLVVSLTFGSAPTDFVYAEKTGVDETVDSTELMEQSTETIISSEEVETEETSSEATSSDISTENNTHITDENSSQSSSEETSNDITESNPSSEGSDVINENTSSDETDNDNPDAETDERDSETESEAQTETELETETEEPIDSEYSKEEYLGKVEALNGYCEGTFSNQYLEAAISSSGNFTFGTKEGNPNYTSDNNAKLLYGHPNPRTSETLITVDGEEYVFYANDISIDDASDFATAVMDIEEEGITVYQNISFYTNPLTGRADTAHVTYSVSNSSGTSHSVGVRIMLDTMLNHNDDAPFKINGIGNVTKMLELKGNAITQTYQVYDDLDNPTTMACGTLWLNDDERKPDKVQYCYWGDIRGSSWNHQIDSTDDIGDSAVGIYYNPTTLASGKSFNVGTYYGTGLGLTGNSSDDGVIGTTPSSNIPKNAIDIHVIDPATRKAISGVTVTVDEVGEAKTDSTGKVRFSNVNSSLNSQNLSVTFKKNGYVTTTKSFRLITGMPFTFYLRSNDNKAPIVTGVTMTSSNSKYNNKDLLSSVVSFTENSAGVEAKANINKEEVTINVSSDFIAGDEAASYQLVQDKMTVMDSKNGVFHINTVTNNLNGKNYTENRICDFSANKKIYLRVISKNGEMSNLVALGIDVKQASDTTLLLSGSDDSFGSIDFGQISEAAKILEIFFGDNKKLNMPKVPIKAMVTEDGKVRVAITTDLLGDDIGKFDSYEKKYNQKYAKAVLNTSYAMKNIMAEGQHAESIGVGNLSLSFNIEGYGEGYISDGQLKVEVGVIATLSGEASHTHTFFVGAFPLYIKVGGGASLECSANAKMGLLGQNPYIRFYLGEFKPSINLYAELGAGASGVLSAGIQGKGVLDATWNFDENYKAVDLTASAAITLHALLYDNEINIAQHTWNLYRDTGLGNTSNLNSGDSSFDN